MKYPVVKIKQIPRGFKHCEVVVLAHMEFKNVEEYTKGEEAAIKRAYFTFLEEEAAMLLDSLMTLYRPMRFQYKGQWMIALKDNADYFKLKDTVNKLMLEIEHYTNHTIQMEVHLLDVMLMQEGEEPTLFKARKVGVGLEEDQAYSTKVYRPTGKINQKEISFITPYAEFKLTKYNTI